MTDEQNVPHSQGSGNGDYRVGYKKPPREHQFKPGQSGNPGGMPKGASILRPLLRKLSEHPNQHGEGVRAERLADLALQLAEAGGDIGSVLKLMERTDGPVKQQIETSGTQQIITKRVTTNRTEINGRS